MESGRRLVAFYAIILSTKSLEFMWFAGNGNATTKTQRMPSTGRPGHLAVRQSRRNETCRNWLALLAQSRSAACFSRSQWSEKTAFQTSNGWAGTSPPFCLPRIDRLALANKFAVFYDVGQIFEHAYIHQRITFHRNEIGKTPRLYAPHFVFFT